MNFLSYFNIRTIETIHQLNHLKPDMKQNNNKKPATGIQMKKNTGKTPKANKNSWIGQPVRPKTSIRNRQYHAASAALGMVMVDRVSNGLSALPQSSKKAIQDSFRGTRGKKGEKHYTNFLPSLSQDLTEDSNDLLEKGNGNTMISKKPSLSSSDVGDDDLGDDDIFPLLDPSLIMSMERTVLSAYNQAFQIMMVGAGLMAVGAKDDDTPAHLGIFIFVAGIIYGLISYWVHYSRLAALSSGGKISMQSSLYWIGALMLFATVGMSFELYFAVVYPYLTRAQEVSIAAGDMGGGGSSAAVVNATMRL